MTLSVSSDGHRFSGTHAAYSINDRRDNYPISGEETITHILSFLCDPRDEHPVSSLDSMTHVLYPTPCDPRVKYPLSRKDPKT